MRPDRDALWWTLPGAAAGFVLLTLLSIGILVAPLAGALAVLAASRTGGRGIYGLPVGFGALVAAICLPQRAYTGLGLVGVAIAAAGVALCLAQHSVTRTR